MTCKYIIEDSSFVISLMNSLDPLHSEALSLFKALLACNKELKIVIPSVVFYETMLVLLKTGMHYQIVKEKLLRLMMIDNIVNHSISETAVLKMGKYAQKLINEKTNKTRVRSNDLMIVSIAMSYEHACLLTADKGIKEYDSIFSTIFCFNDADDKSHFLSMINS